MHPDNRDHLGDVFVKPGSDLRTPPAWLCKPIVLPSSIEHDVRSGLTVVRLDEMTDVDSDKLPPPDPRAVFWTPDED